ncbi:GDP-mannose 4,6-dehydratase [Salimicrobium jeotgali]|uniref:GDP-mannose 4,6-dehydratase n=1 Tax=Salimicrobium jeotgali TaxID=1230341 RepID=UPI000C8668FB|nr:GDP-mannose 4,6-dehydratase [Salimicrobium jeotgali]
MSEESITSNKTYLVTGAAGFIGYYLSKKLLKQGCTVLGIDNLNEYYDVNIKYTRLERLASYENFTFIKKDIAEKEEIIKIFREHRPHIVINLAAQAGVRYSIENPDVYIQSNIIGFYNVLEACRYFPVEHLIYASSSSVYGTNEKVPFEETDFVDHPVSLYASTKRANELTAYTYSHLYGIPSTGLRFFTVYGPLGRPDMAYYSFTDKLFDEEPIKIFNNGDFENDLYRDFTYIDDIVGGIEKLIPHIPTGEVSHEIYNIGNNEPVKLMDFIWTLEKVLSKSLGKKKSFQKQYEPIKPGDVPATYASTDRLFEAIGYRPNTSIEEGLQKFTDWYVQYYNKK